MKPGTLVTLVLGTLAGLFGLVLLWQVSGLGGGIAPPQTVADSPVPPDRPSGLAEVQRLDSMKEYDLITQRPLFNEDRQPWVAPPEVVDGPGEGGKEPEIPEVKLDVRLTGVIISPQVKIALLADNATKQSMSVREGMPLEGPLAAWQVASISPREVSFRSSQNDSEAVVELDVDASTLGGNRRRAAAARPAGQNADGGQRDTGDAESAETRAEELRRKVAERRAQLRAEAQRRADENNN
ncbi:MAG: hypothetical protein DHS20C11_24070 [Lysobacteraceae bacterium]|nr:MAG: hypothetical protein DHS20C11_24070 [Xanthomonadaceae bacterium]